jgi:DNA-binding response OmpR family regulator
MVVNDDPAILQLFEDLLSEEGYRVSLDKFDRQTGELLQSIRELKPDLVIMDFLIGREESGWQLLQITQMDRDTRGIPVIICTGAVKQVTEMSTHLDALGIHVVIKPFDIDALLTIVDKVWQAQGSPTPGLDTIGTNETSDAASA